MSIYINLPQTQSCIGYTVNAIWWYSSVLQHDVPTKPSPGHAHNDKDKYWLNRWDLTVAGSWRGIRPLCSGAQLANEISAPRSSNERRCSHPARDTCYLAQRLSCERLRQIGGVLSVWHPPPASLSRDNLAQASHFFFPVKANSLWTSFFQTWPDVVKVIKDAANPVIVRKARRHKMTVMSCRPTYHVWNVYGIYGRWFLHLLQGSEGAHPPLLCQRCAAVPHDSQRHKWHGCKQEAGSGKPNLYPISQWGPAFSASSPIPLFSLVLRRVDMA